MRLWCHYSYRATCQAEREGEALYSSERPVVSEVDGEKKGAGGEDVLPQWTSNSDFIITVRFCAA